MTASGMFSSPYHAGPCSLSRDCGHHCGTMPVTGTRHCCCCCNRRILDAEVVPAPPRRRTPMCWGRASGPEEAWQT